MYGFPCASQSILCCGDSRPVLWTCRYSWSQNSVQLSRYAPFRSRQARSTSLFRASADLCSGRLLKNGPVVQIKEL